MTSRKNPLLDKNYNLALGQEIYDRVVSLSDDLAGRSTWDMISIGVAICAAACDIGAEASGTTIQDTRKDLSEIIVRLITECPSILVSGEKFNESLPAHAKAIAAGLLHFDDTDEATLD